MGEQGSDDEAKYDIGGIHKRECHQTRTQQVREAEIQKFAAENSDDGPSRRNLTQEFEAAAAAQSRMEDEEELVADPPPAQVHQPTQEARQHAQQQLPREATADDFWCRMNNMLESKVGQLSTEVADAMGHLEVRMTDKIAKESRARATETQATNKRIGDIVKRLSDLEHTPTGEKAAGATTPTTSTAWQPQHMIFGWPAEMDREKLLDEMRARLQELPGDLRDLLLHPYAPRKRTTIAKTKVEPGSRAKVAWRLQQRLQEHSTLR